MAWIILVFAGLFEIVWAYSMKLSEGFTNSRRVFLRLFLWCSVLYSGLCHAYFASRNCLYHLDGHWRSRLISGRCYSFR
jgi:Membrane transporters of cations and cationic drugs